MKFDYGLVVPINGFDGNEIENFKLIKLQSKLLQK